MSGESAAVIALVFLAAAYLVFRLVRVFTGRNTGCNCGCRKCPKNNNGGRSTMSNDQ